MRSNWLDQCRLLFAFLVITCHSFQLVAARDPLEALGAPTDLGKVSVAGFLLISGYLISQVLERDPSLGQYLRNRALRIAPAFCAAFWLSLLLALAVGGHGDWRRLPIDVLTLHQPSAWFPGERPANGPMWTIQLEVACYLIAPAVMASRRLLLGTWLVAAALTALTPQSLPVGEPLSFWIRGVLMFLSGAAYHRLGASARLWPMTICALALPLLLSSAVTWEVGLAVAGGYLLLSLGLQQRPRFAWADISYGVYLYGWPIQVVLILAGVTSSWQIAGLALSTSLLAGYFSWRLIEAPALRLKQPAPGVAAPASGEAPC